jgi:hypothetical protein
VDSERPSKDFPRLFKGFRGFVVKPFETRQDDHLLVIDRLPELDEARGDQESRRLSDNRPQVLPPLARDCSDDEDLPFRDEKIFTPWPNITSSLPCLVLCSTNFSNRLMYMVAREHADLITHSAILPWCSHDATTAQCFQHLQRLAQT